MTKLRSLEKLAKERIKQAEDRKLHNKIAVVLGEFGQRTSEYDSYGLSSEHKRFYRAGRLLIQEITHGETMFDSYGSYGSDSSTWIEALFDNIKVYHESHYCMPGGKVLYPIEMYVPGKWEEWLERPYAEANKIVAGREKQKKEREEKWRAEEERRKIRCLQKNFGLGGNKNGQFHRI